MKDIDWSEQPTSEYVWIEDLKPDSCGDFSGWYRLAGEKWVICSGKGFWNRNDDENGHIRIHRKPEPEYMPKVGEWCEVRIANSWTKVRFHGECERVGYYVFYTDTFVYREIKPSEFRPIKSDRDVFIDRAVVVMNASIDDSQKGWAEAIYDNGARFTDD